MKSGVMAKPTRADEVRRKDVLVGVIEFIWGDTLEVFARGEGSKV